MSKASLGDYVKAAFKWHWNLLALGAGVVVAYVSGQPQTVLPLIAAAELTYLAGLVSIPKFRSYVERTKSGVSSNSAPPPVPINDQVANMLAELAPGPRDRFQQLKTRCETMQRLARKVTGGVAPDETSNTMRNEGLDKLLWVFLRLLYSQQGLWRFLEEANARELEVQLERLEARRKKLGEVPDERLLKSLVDAIATTTMRLDNVRAAKNNSEFVDLELERIESKIMALSEMAVNNQNPDYITTQVDAVADSISVTESAMKELNYLTGLSNDMQREPPKILARN
jgi:hypothetical protein